jgi:hypothetical protein
VSKERATLKAVIAYSEQLSMRAHRQMAGDPYAKPYYPTTAAARKVYHDHLAGIRRGDTDDTEADLEETEQEHLAAERALATLRMRVVLRERESDGEIKEADRALKRLQKNKRRAELDRDAQRAGMSVGQRIDRALNALACVAAPGAAQIGSSTGAGDPRVMPSDHGDPAGEAAYVARQAMRKVEELLDRARARDVGKAA